MLNHLKDLTAVQSQLSQRDTQRLGVAQEHYAQANELLKAYNRNLDKQTLRQCMLLLTESIRAARSYPEPYILLAYIYQALRMPQLALKYLRVAEHLQAGHPLVAKIKQALLDGFEAPVVSRGGGGSASSFAMLDLDDIDYDALYDEVEALIAREVAAAQDIPVPVRPLASKEMIAELKSYQGGLADTLALVNGQLSIVEQEIDCAPLRSRLSLIETRWRQLMTLEEVCRAGMALSRSLLQTMSDVQIEQMELSPSEQRLEAFLDQCDAFADKIDELSDKGLNIREIQNDYETLVEGITQLQDRLDSV